MCVCMHAHVHARLLVCMYAMYMQVPEKGIVSPETGVTDGYGLSGVGDGN